MTALALERLCDGAGSAPRTAAWPARRPSNSWSGATPGRD